MFESECDQQVKNVSNDFLLSLRIWKNSSVLKVSYRSPFLLAGRNSQPQKCVKGLKILSDIICSSSSEWSKEHNWTKTVSSLHLASNT